MHSVKVRQGNVSVDTAAEEIRRGLGHGYQVEPREPDGVSVRKGYFGRARVGIQADSDGTVFEVRGEGVVLPLAYIITRVMNDSRIARKVADAIEQSPGLRGDGH